MKKRILSIALTIAMLLCMMPLAVSAAEAPTKLDLTFEKALSTKTRVSDANSLFVSNIVESNDSHVNVYTSTIYTCLFVKNGESFEKPNSDDYLDTSLNYYLSLELYTNSGYSFDLDAVKSGDFTGFTLTVNGTIVPLNNYGTTHYVTYAWSETNITLLVPLSYFAEIEEIAWVQDLTVSHEEKSVQKGSSFTFTADVVAYGGASTAVTWAFREGSVPQSAETTIVDGVLTVGADETLTYAYIRVKSVANENIYKDIYVAFTNDAPSITAVEFEKDSIDVVMGSISYDTKVSLSGLEVDRRVTFTLTGGTKEGTKIITIYDDYVQFQIDKTETAETLTLTATSVADPSKSDTLTINVKQPPVVGNDIYFNLDFDKLDFDPSKTEGDVKSQIRDNLTLDSTLSPNIAIDNSNSGLMWLNGSSSNGIGDGSESVDLSKTYLLYVTLDASGVYTWSDKIKTEDFSDLNVYLNGVKYGVFEASYNDYWDNLKLYLIPTWFDAEFTGASLSLGSDLSLNYFVKHNNVENLPLNKMAVQFTINERTVLVKNYTIVGGEYVFSLKGIAPQEACDNITASIVELNDDGVTVKRVVKTKADYSVSDNILDLKKAHSENEDMLALLKALIWYCEYAQKYLNYTPNGSICQALPSIAGNDIPTYSPDASDNVYALDNVLAAGSRLTAAGVRFSSDNKLYVKVHAAETVTLVVKKAGAVVDTVTLDAGVHTYYTEGILATEFDVIYTFELTVGESATPAQTLTYSVNSYAIRTATKTESGAPSKMANLARALYNYGKACEAFVAAS